MGKNRKILKGVAAGSVVLMVLLAGCQTVVPEQPVVTQQVISDPVVSEPVVIEIKNILSQEADELIRENRDNPDFMIIDVRTEEEYAAGHIEGAVNINIGRLSFSEEIGKLDRDAIYLVYCRTGNRSYGAVTMMQEMGFQTIHHLVYGITEWMNAGYPVVKPQ